MIPNKPKFRIEYEPIWGQNITVCQNLYGDEDNQISIKGTIRRSQLNDKDIRNCWQCITKRYVETGNFYQTLPDLMFVCKALYHEVNKYLQQEELLKYWERDQINFQIITTRTTTTIGYYEAGESFGGCGIDYYFNFQYAEKDLILYPSKREQNWLLCQFLQCYFSKKGYSEFIKLREEVLIRIINAFFQHKSSECDLILNNFKAFLCNYCWNDPWRNETSLDRIQEISKVLTLLTWFVENKLVSVKEAEKLLDSAIKIFSCYVRREYLGSDGVKLLVSFVESKLIGAEKISPKLTQYEDLAGNFKRLVKLKNTETDIVNNQIKFSSFDSSTDYDPDFILDVD